MGHRLRLQHFSCDKRQSENMTDPFTVKPVYNVLSQYIGNRADVGAGKAMRDGVLEPFNPFERKAARPPRRWFVLFSLVSALFFGCFNYFNNLL